MKKVTLIQINTAIKRARELYLQTKNTLLKKKIQNLLSLRRRYSSLLRNYYKICKTKRERVIKAADFISEMLLKIEVGMLRSGAVFINCMGNVPVSEEKFVIYFQNVIEKFEQKQVASVACYIEQLKTYYNQFMQEIDREKSDFDNLCKECARLSKEIEDNIAAIEQFLNPEKFTVVNVRDRFD